MARPTPLRPALALPCGIAPRGPSAPHPLVPLAPRRPRPSAPRPQRDPSAPPRAPLQLGPARPSLPTRRPPLAHVLGPAPRRARPAFTPTAYQVEQLLAEERGFFGRNTGRPMGYLPVRADAHPDGRVRLVVEGIAVPASAVPPYPKPAVPGKQMAVIIPPAKVERPWTTAGAYLSMIGAGEDKIVEVDPDPAWFAVEDRRFIAPKPGVSSDVYTTTSEEAVDASGFKAPAKQREQRQQHWINVAWVLRTGRPVTSEVLSEYPDLAEFYAQSVLTEEQVDALLDREEEQQRALDNPDDPHVWLSWKPTEGMLLRTRGKEQVIIDAVHALSGVRFKWSRHMGCYYRPQSVGVSESTVDIDRVARQLRAAGLVVAVERGEVSTLGVANTRRRAHKQWRAEGYAGRAEGALDKGAGAEARAAQLRADLPAGAATRRAERVEQRAERAEGQAVEHMEYVAHAAAVAQNLSATAARYDVTVEITRKAAEKRADAFATLFVRKVKGLVGAVRLKSDKTDNLSEYKLIWVVYYPPAAKVMASVVFDGRKVTVSTYDGEGSRASKVVVLKEDVTHVDPEEVFRLAVDALPKYSVDPAAPAPTDPQAFVDELSAYGRKRTAGLTAAAGVKEIMLRASGRWYGNPWSTLSMVESRSDMYSARDVRWSLQPLDGLRFNLRRSRSKPHSGYYGDAPPDDVLGSVELDFTGLTIAQAWDVFLAGVRAVASGAPLVMPKLKVAKSRPAGVTRGEGVIGDDPRHAADAPARAHRAALAERLAPVVAEADARRDALRGGESAAARLAAAREVTAAAGKDGAFYPTPPSLADRVVELARLTPSDAVLEPSAGMGALVQAALKGRHGNTLTAFELDPARAAYLQQVYGPGGVGVFERDFLAQPPRAAFDAVVMNPPFSLGSRHYTDAEHVLHAMGFLVPGGRLVAIMSAESRRDNHPRRQALHAALVGWGASWEPVDAKRFRISGTDVPSIILTATRPKENGWLSARRRGAAPRR